MESGILRIAKNVASAHRCTANITYTHQFPATVNHETETLLATKAATELVGKDRIHHNLPPCMGSEDFSYMLNKRPGSYIWMGNSGDPGGCFLHNPKYDFNDESLVWGASYWANLVQTIQPNTSKLS